LRRLDEVERKLFGEAVGRTYGDEHYLKSMELLIAGEGRVRACTSETLQVVDSLKKVLAAGVYVAKWKYWGVILSVEGSQLLREENTINTVELDGEMARKWMMGAPVPLRDWNGQKIVVGRYRGFMLGSAIVGRDGVAYPQIPKWRRLQEE